MKFIPIAFCFFQSAAAGEFLEATVSSPKISGQKALIRLELVNGLSQRIESARAAVFLTDEAGKLAAQSSRWVIGGTDTNGLTAGKTNTFHFVVTADRPFSTTNLTAKVVFSRLVLEGGKTADVTDSVIVRADEK